MFTRQEVGVAILTAFLLAGAICTAALLGAVYLAQLGVETTFGWFRKVQR